MNDTNKAVLQYLNVWLFFLSHRGANLSCTSVDAPDRIAVLKAEIALLDRREKELDEHKMWVQQSVKNVTDDAGNYEYLLTNVITKIVDLKKIKCYLLAEFAIVVCRLSVYDTSVL